LLKLPPEMLMVPELLRVAELKMAPEMLRVPELLRVAPLLLEMPKTKPVFDIVMMPELLMVPPLFSMEPKMSIWPLDVTSMVPVAKFFRVRSSSIVSSPFTVMVFVDSLVREPPGTSIISIEPFSIVSVPLVSVNEISRKTSTDPSMTILSEPVGSASLLQLNRSDHIPPGLPSQIPLGSTGSILKSSKKNVDPPGT